MKDFFNKILEKFKEDFFKYSLILVWSVTLIFILLINLISLLTYGDGKTVLAVFERSKMIIELVLSIPFVIGFVALLLNKRVFAERLGMILSGIILFEAGFFITISLMSDITGNANVLLSRPSLVILKYVIFILLHIYVIILSIIDIKKNGGKDVEKKVDKSSKKKEAKKEDIEKKKKPKVEPKVIEENEEIEKEETEEDATSDNFEASAALSKEENDALDELNKAPLKKVSEEEDNN